MAPEDFEHRFLEVCAAHRRDGRALVFCIIAHDFEQPQVLQVLGDDAYWMALHSISGDRITVFAFHAPTSPNHDNISYFWREEGRAPGDSARSILHLYFQLGQSLELPCLVFFQADESGVSDAVDVRIRSERNEDAFLEIKEVIGRASDALRRVDEEHRGNDGELFELVRVALQNLRVERTIKRVTPVLPRLLRALNTGT